MPRKPKASPDAASASAGEQEETRYTVELMARFLGVDEIRVRKLSKRGALPNISDGKMPLIRTVQRMIKTLDDDLISHAEAAECLSLSHERVRQLTGEGFIKRQASGEYRRRDVYEGYIRFLRDEDRKTTKVAAESGLKKAKQAEVELRLAERRRELVPTEDAEAVIAGLCALIRNNIDALPARVTRDKALRKIVEKEVDDALTRIAQGAAEIGRALRSGGEVTATGEEDAS